jgi:hypothetical protein
MPMKKDPEGGGLNADGSRSDRYCSLCYHNGEFYFSGDDVVAFQTIVVEEMVKKGWWRPIAWLVTRGIPQLPRWKKIGDHHP